MRIVYSNDGLIFVTYDHYKTFYEIVQEKYTSKKVVIDFSECQYVGSLHNEIKSKLNLPDWYGRNLNALWDSLTGIIETPVEIKIVFKPKTKAVQKMEPFVKQIMDVFKDAESEYNEIKLFTDID